MKPEFRCAPAIHASVADIRTAIDTLKPRSAVVLQIERRGQFIFLPFELE
jgi:hypothetical protein